jgi:hypothetical protein
MDHLTADLLARIERLEARLKTQEATQSSAADASTAPTEESAAEPSSRRDLFRYGAAALGVAVTGIATAARVEAVDGSPLIVGFNNTSTGGTHLTTTSTGGGSLGLGVRADQADYGTFITARRTGTYSFVIDATLSSDAGVVGGSGAFTGSAAGVYGFANSPTAPGVYGSHEYGGSAVLAEVPSTATEQAISLYALNYSSYIGPGPGAGGFAIYGLSAKGHGLVGATAAAGAAAVVGATNGVAGAYAAAFYGPVIVSGNFTVVGGAKSAAVPHPDGSHRRLYCVESPESWFEGLRTRNIGLRGSSGAAGSGLRCGRGHQRLSRLPHGLRRAV